MGEAEGCQLVLNLVVSEPGVPEPHAQECGLGKDQLPSFIS